MTYKEAQEKALTVKWKVGVCNSGEECWCRTIVPEEPIFDKDNNEIWIVGQGELSKLFSEHIVKLHNESL